MKPHFHMIRLLYGKIIEWAIGLTINYCFVEQHSKSSNEMSIYEHKTPYRYLLRLQACNEEISINQELEALTPPAVPSQKKKGKRSSFPLFHARFEKRLSLLNVLS